MRRFRFPQAPPPGWLSEDEDIPAEVDNGSDLTEGEESSTEKSDGEESGSEQQDGGHRVVPSKWLAGSWPLKPFDDSLATNKRKAEWIHFRDQFERIVSCKGRVDPQTKLTGLKIHAGTFLLSIIEMQEKTPQQGKDVYESAIASLNKYFNQLCDATQERMKFREMKQKETEAFADWVLRLEAQAKFCEFSEDQRKEEFVQALLRRSMPAIAEKLYEMSDVFENCLDKIINHGQHLDHIRSEAKESTTEAKQAPIKEEGTEEEVEKPVNSVSWKSSKGKRFEPYKRQGTEGSSGGSWSRSSAQQRFGGMQFQNKKCRNCGRVHAPRQCKAFRAKCFECGKNGHFAEVCESKRSNNDGRERVKTEAEKINQVNDGWD